MIFNLTNNSEKKNLEGKWWKPEEDEFEIPPLGSKTFSKTSPYLELEIYIKDNAKYITCVTSEDVIVFREKNKNIWRVIFHSERGDIHPQGPANVEAGVKD